MKDLSVNWMMSNRLYKLNWQLKLRENQTCDKFSIEISSSKDSTLINSVRTFVNALISARKL